MYKYNGKKYYNNKDKIHKIRLNGKRCSPVSK